MSWIADLRPYEPCIVTGTVLRLRVAPLEGEVSAIVGDGTDELRAVWHLGRPTPQLGLAPGVAILLEGVPRTDPDGSLVMREPCYFIDPVATA